MRFRTLSHGMMAVCLAGLAGCKPAPNVTAVPNPGTSAPPISMEITNAQAKLPSMKLWLGSQELNAEVALTTQQVRTGMMFRKEMADNEGMLFVFGQPHQTSFYMKNTYVPLSCAYIDPEGVIREIHDMKPLDETPIEASGDNILYVLEVRQGWFRKNNIQVGTEVRAANRSLREVFFKRR